MVKKLVVDGDILLADGFDDCFLGVAQRFGFEGEVAAYDLDMVLDKLVKRDGMTEVEAYEFYEFNFVGAWVGPQTPIFITKMDGIER